MYFVYILVSEKDSRRYIGSTKNLERRLVEHNSGVVKSSKNRRPLRLLYYETFELKSDALIRERAIKAKKGKFIIPG